MKLQCALEQVAEQSTLSDEEITEEPQSSSAIREMLNSWECVASYIKKHHPNQTVAIRSTELFNNKATSEINDTRQFIVKRSCMCPIIKKNIFYFPLYLRYIDKILVYYFPF